MDHQICPWCQTEIVWDPELGPEEYCPHCENKLGGYNSLTLGDDEDKQGTVDKKIKYEDTGDIEDIAFDDDEDVDDSPGYTEGLAAGIGLNDEELYRYESIVGEYLEVQEDVVQCSQCREDMLFAGEQKVEGSGFSPNRPKASAAPFLQTPFTLRVFVCPSCYQVHYNLSENDRMKMVQTLLNQAD